MSTDLLRKLVVLKTAQGTFHAVGRVISYCEAPTVTIVRPNGERANWRADMLTVIEVDDSAADELCPISPPQSIADLARHAQDFIDYRRDR